MNEEEIMTGTSLITFRENIQNIYMKYASNNRMTFTKHQ